MADIWNDKYPEHARARAVVDKTQAAGEFLDWLNEAGWMLRDADGHRCYLSSEELLAEWTGVNLNELEREKRLMLEDIRRNYQDLENAEGAEEQLNGCR